MVPLDLIIFFAGICYGFLKPGKEDLEKILGEGMKVSFVIGIVAGALMYLGGGVSALVHGGIGVVGFVLTVFVFTLVFIFGTYLGDRLEFKVKNSRN